jgi:hypothetical protein
MDHILVITQIYEERKIDQFFPICTRRINLVHLLHLGNKSNEEISAQSKWQKAEDFKITHGF